MAVFHEFEQVSVRSLLRQSAYYGRVLEALQNPAALQSEESRRKITGRLNQYFQKHGAEHLLSIARAEEIVCWREIFLIFTRWAGERT